VIPAGQARKNRPLPLNAALLALLAGCATTGEEQEQTGLQTRVVPHEYEMAVSGGKDKAEQKDSGEAKSDQFKLYPGTGEVVRPAPPPSPQPAGQDVVLNFEGADIREVVKTVLGEILRENYIIDPKVAGTVTLRTTRPIQRNAVLPTLETVLRMSGAAVVREADGLIRVVPSNLAGKGNVTPQLGGQGRPPPGGYSVQIVPLQYIGAPDMARILEPMMADPGAVRIDPIRNLMILSGTALELRHLLDTIGMFDMDWVSGMSVGLFTLKNVDVKTITAEVEKVFGDKALGPLAGAVRLIPIERLNALLIISRQKSYLEQARTWVERLDRGGVGGGGLRLFVYPVQNGKAEHLATLLNDIFSKQKVQKTAPAPSLAPGMVAAEVKAAEPAQQEPKVAPLAEARPVAVAGEGVAVPQELRVIADKDNNALLILATMAEYESIQLAIRQLDVAPRQVLIEVTIAEISLTDELKYGLEWFFSTSNGKGQLDTGSSGVGPLVPGFSFSWLSGAGDIRAVLNALGTASKLKVIASPHVTVADNQTAKIQIGDRVPTISQTQSVPSTGLETGIISTVQYVETGVILAVTPSINAGGLVSLDISQEVSNATQTLTSGIDSPTIQKRTAQSKVGVQSGQTLVLAGLILERKNDSSSGVPLLSKIPVLGALFGVQDFKDERTELILLITPRVLHDTQQASAITDEFRRRLTGLDEMLKSLELEKGVGVPDKAVEGVKQGATVNLEQSTELSKRAAETRKKKPSKRKGSS
jgi:general secretion pathway protein D